MKVSTIALFAIGLLLPATAALAEEPKADAYYEPLFYQAALKALNAHSDVNLASDAQAEPLFRAAMERAVAAYEAGEQVVVADR